MCSITVIGSWMDTGMWQCLSVWKGIFKDEICDASLGISWTCAADRKHELWAPVKWHAIPPSQSKTSIHLLVDLRYRKLYSVIIRLTFSMSPTKIVEICSLSLCNCLRNILDFASWPAKPTLFTILALCRKMSSILDLEYSLVALIVTGAE